MAKVNYPLIRVGALVRTTKENPALRGEWTEEALAGRKWGVQGEVFDQHDSHGLCYEVRHADGTTGYYDPSELRILLE